MGYPVAQITITDLSQILAQDPKLGLYITNSITINNNNGDNDWEQNWLDKFKELYKAALGVDVGVVSLNKTDENSGFLVIQPDEGDPGSIYEVPYLVVRTLSEFDNP